MTNAKLAFLLLGLIAAIIVLRVLARAGVRRLVNSDLFAASPARATAVSIRKWLRDFHPRFAFFMWRRLRPGVFTGLPLTLLVLAACYIAALLAGLVHEVVEAEGTHRFDQAINMALASFRHPTLVSGFLWITALGSGPALTAVAITATGFLWADRRTGFIVPLWLALAGAQLTTWAGKYAIDRQRPDFIEGVSAALSPSFPSGHATGAMAVYGFLAYAIARPLRGWSPRFEVVYWTAILIVLIGFSRIFLSMHYTTDVAAGFLVGGFWLLVAFVVAEWKEAPSRT